MLRRQDLIPTLGLQALTLLADDAELGVNLGITQALLHTGSDLRSLALGRCAR